VLAISGAGASSRRFSFVTREIGMMFLDSADDLLFGMSAADIESEPNGSKPNTAEHCGKTAAPEASAHLEILKSIVAVFFVVYDRLGPWFLERVYAGALAIELRRRGHKVARELSVPVFYDGIQVARYTMDFVVDNCVVVEIKSTEHVTVADRRQLVNYLRCTNFEDGLLLHFGPRPRFHKFHIPRSNHRPKR
jgi:GxxExxY protein